MLYACAAKFDVTGKDLSRKLQINCAISYLFYLYLMLYTCTAKFDVMKNLKFFGNKA